MAVKVDSADVGAGGIAIGGTLAEINIIPLVDVILVLLLIFMLTAPLMYRGIDVNLPRSVGEAHRGRGANGAHTDEGAGDLPQRQADRHRRRSSAPAHRLQGPHDKTLYLRADQALQYGFVVETMDRVRRAGIEKLGMVTEPTRGAMASVASRAGARPSPGSRRFPQRARRSPGRGDFPRRLTMSPFAATS